MQGKMFSVWRLWRMGTERGVWMQQHQGCKDALMRRHASIRRFTSRHWRRSIPHNWHFALVWFFICSLGCCTRVILAEYRRAFGVFHVYRHPQGFTLVFDCQPVSELKSFILFRHSSFSVLKGTLAGCHTPTWLSPIPNGLPPLCSWAELQTLSRTDFSPWQEEKKLLKKNTQIKMILRNLNIGTKHQISPIYFKLWSSEINQDLWNIFNLSWRRFSKSDFFF